MLHKIAIMEYLSLRQQEHTIGVHVKCPIFSCPILTESGVYWQIFIESAKSNFMEIRPLGAEMIHADGWGDRRTDMMKIIDDFRDYASWLKK